MIKKIVYLMLPLVFSATSCGDLLKNGHEYFTVRNESDRKIFFDWCTNYKDTVIRPEHITPNRIAWNHYKSIIRTGDWYRATFWENRKAVQ